MSKGCRTVGVHGVKGSMEWGSRGEGSLVVGGSRDGRDEGMVGVKRMKAV